MCLSSVVLKKSVVETWYILNNFLNFSEIVLQYTRGGSLAFSALWAIFRPCSSVPDMNFASRSGFSNFLNLIIVSAITDVYKCPMWGSRKKKKKKRITNTHDILCAQVKNIASWKKRLITGVNVKYRSRYKISALKFSTVFIVLLGKKSFR